MKRLFGFRKEAILSAWNIWDSLDPCVIALSERGARDERALRLFWVLADDFPSVDEAVPRVHPEPEFSSSEAAEPVSQRLMGFGVAFFTLSFTFFHLLFLPCSIFALVMRRLGNLFSIPSYCS